VAVKYLESIGCFTSQDRIGVPYLAEYRFNRLALRRWVLTPILGVW
jgi:hypothetical protein